MTDIKEPEIFVQFSGGESRTLHIPVHGLSTKESRDWFKVILSVCLISLIFNAVMLLIVIGISAKALR